MLHSAKSVGWLAAGFEDKTAYAQCIFAYTPGKLSDCLTLSGFKNSIATQCALPKQCQGLSYVLIQHECWVKPIA